MAGIIIGLPRGGSTLLQRLLCTSQQVNHTPWWELISPLPLAGEAAGDPTPRIELGKKMAQGIYDAWPEMVAMHRGRSTRAGRGDPADRPHADVPDVQLLLQRSELHAVAAHAGPEPWLFGAGDVAQGTAVPAAVAARTQVAAQSRRITSWAVGCAPCSTRSAERKRS